jgi:hypothetical protein
MAFLKNLQVKD